MADSSAKRVSRKTQSTTSLTTEAPRIGISGEVKASQASGSSTISGGDATGGGIRIVQGKEFVISAAKAGAPTLSEKQVNRLMRLYGVQKVEIEQAVADGANFELEDSDEEESSSKNSMYIRQQWPTQQNALRITRSSISTLVPSTGQEMLSISPFQSRSDDGPSSDTVVGVVVGVLLGVLIFITTALLWLRGRRRQNPSHRGHRRRHQSHRRPQRRMPTILLNGRRCREYDREEGSQGEAGGRGGAELPSHVGLPGQVGLPVGGQGRTASGHIGELNRAVSGLGGGGEGGLGHVELEDPDEGSSVEATGGSGIGGEGRGGVGGYGGPEAVVVMVVSAVQAERGVRMHRPLPLYIPF
ncbi:hypothetical protein F5Y10DRAFT_263474 [Nemania abortiva]|nr:hypothetical protein F5Y10DRAFT_263474 [Nemania abortiva]